MTDNENLREDLVERIDEVKNHNEELRDKSYKLYTEKEYFRSGFNFMKMILIFYVGNKSMNKTIDYFKS